MKTKKIKKTETFYDTGTHSRNEVETAKRVSKMQKKGWEFKEKRKDYFMGSHFYVLTFTKEIPINRFHWAWWLFGIFIGGVIIGLLAVSGWLAWILDMFMNGNN